MPQTYFVTGASGCIGAWIVKQIVERGDRAVVFDLSDDPRRMRLVIEPEHLTCVEFVVGDVADGHAVSEALAHSGALRVIHLAGLQVPACRANPARGALVNVIGTLNVFEAARLAGAERVVYASSAAVFGAFDDDTAVDESTPCEPATHYGVYKRANEGNARIYHLDHGLCSVGLRPLTVYGVGRDQGLTSDPTKAMKAAVVGRSFRIRFGGATDFIYVADIAATFLACADRAPAGAHVFNVHGQTARVARVAELIEHYRPESGGLVTVEGPPLPIAANIDDGALRQAVPGIPATPLDDGVARTLDRFAALQEAGRLSTHDLDD